MPLKVTHMLTMCSLFIYINQLNQLLSNIQLLVNMIIKSITESVILNSFQGTNINL